MSQHRLSTVALHAGQKPDPTTGVRKVPGIGEDFIPKTFNRQVVDEIVRVSDKNSFN